MKYAWFVLCTMFITGCCLDSNKASVEFIEGEGILIHNTKDSVFYFPWIQEAPSQDALDAAQHLVDYMETGDLDYVEKALKLYRKIIPIEKFGSEYSALEWFCEYCLASDSEGLKMLENNKDGTRLLRIIGENNYETFKTYLNQKYSLGFSSEEIEAKERRRLYIRYVDEFIRFNSPKREQWEKSDKIIEAMKLKPGDEIADVGCGPGFFSFKFAEAVGDDGTVYAIDFNIDHLDYLAKIRDSESLNNIEIVLSESDDVQLAENSIDHAFMCASYQVVYGCLVKEMREAFIGSLKKALRKGGHLVIVDNTPAQEGDFLPYYGYRISADLIKAQLSHFGFRLIDEQYFISQRYFLVFEEID